MRLRQRLKAEWHGRPHRARGELGFDLHQQETGIGISRLDQIEIGPEGRFDADDGSEPRGNFGISLFRSQVWILEVGYTKVRGRRTVFVVTGDARNTERLVSAIAGGLETSDS